MTRLILIRHGETNKNITKKLHHLKDPETLNKKGVLQVKKTALFLKKQEISVVYASTERRAKESGQIFSKTLAIPLKIIHGMQERDWGKFSGRPWSEIEDILKPMSLRERYNYLPPNGESWKEFETRLIKAINKVIEENQGKTVIIVSHGGAIRALMPFLLNVPRQESFKYDPDNASTSIFDYRQKKFLPKAINDTSHLAN